MTGYLWDWVSLLVRWIHIIAGVAWIGASFYLVRLGDPSPPPQSLRWYCWQAYSTWLSGMALLGLVYVDRPTLAIGAGVVLGSWLIYDRLCRSSLARSPVRLAIAIALLGCIVAWGLGALLNGRRAFIVYGAALGTLMVANIFFVIAPGLRNGDPALQWRTRQRSVHNLYFTLPVLFVMISLHAAMMYSGVHTWLVLIALSFSGVCIRAWFVARHKPDGREGFGSLLMLIMGLLALLIIIIGLYPDAEG